METLTCPRCGSTHRQTKEGHNAKGKQRYQCQDCGRFYLLAPHPPGYPLEMRQQALRLYTDRLSLRQVARHLKVNHQTLINGIHADAKKRDKTPPPLPQQVEVVEMDQVYTFCQKKSV